MNQVFSASIRTAFASMSIQNSHRKLACQFTFACDGIPDKIDEPDMWRPAKEIARDMLDGKLLAAGDRPLHALTPTGFVHIGERDEEDPQDRRAPLLSAAGVGDAVGSSKPSVRTAAA